MSDMEKILERRIDALCSNNCLIRGFRGHAKNCACTPARIEFQKLLPLLEAGQEMRKHIDFINYEDGSCPHNCSRCDKSVRAWDAAKSKATE